MSSRTKLFPGKKIIMKKLYVFAVALAAMGPVICRAQVRPGIIGGLNAASYSETVGTTTYSSSAILGYHIGGLLDIPINDHFLIQPQLLFSLKGGENQNDVKFLIHQVQIPVLVEYKLHLGIGQIYGGLGPNFGIGVGAKQTQAGQSESISFGPGADQIKRLDVGLMFTAGYLFDNGFFGALNVTPGLTNEVNEGGSLHFFIFGVSVGYLFP